MELKFCLRLESDYHVGAGHGLGSAVDAALLRDGDGVPVLRGSTLAGLLRDGLQRLLQLGCFPETMRRCKESGRTDSHAPGYCLPSADPCPVCRIFGSPAAAKRWQVGTARPALARSPQDSPWTAGKHAGQVVQRVRVSPRTRRAEPGLLFSEEVGDRRLEFEFTVECPVEDSLTKPEAALVVAAARMVRNLGGARHRGRGECRLHLSDIAEEKRLLERFHSYWLEGMTTETGGPEPQKEWATPPAAASGLLRRRLIARTEEPIIVAERADAGNQIRTLDYIPGTAVLGALATRAAARWDLRDPQSTLYRDFVHVFRRGGVRFGMLYPAENVGNLNNSLYPCIPAPRDLLACQLYPGFAHETARDAHGVTGGSSAAAEPVNCPTCAASERRDVPLKPMGGYVSVRQQPKRLEPRLREEMHVRIHPPSRRAATGALFGYTALDVGQFFLGELACATEQDWHLLRELAGLPGEGVPFSLRVGRACRRGYGLVSVFLEEVPADVPPCWVGADVSGRLGLPSGPITLTLLTDTILADPWGRARQTLDTEGLVAELKFAELGAELQAVRRDEDAAASCYSATRMVDSFNSHLGLPRWRDVALRAGSAVTFHLAGTFDTTAVVERLRQVEREGIGLRREEGFGQVAFNHPVYRNGEGVDVPSVRIPSDLRPGSVGDEIAAPREVQLQHWWSRRLTNELNDWRDFQDTSWTAVARWIRSRAVEGIDALRKELKEWGTPGRLHPRPPLRDKPAFFAKKGKAGEKRLRKLLEALERHTSDPRCRSLGLEMLADRISALVKEAQAKRS